MRRVRVLGYLYQDKNQMIYFRQMVEKNMKRYFPLPDDASIYEVSHLDHLQNISLFFISNLFYAYRAIHHVLDLAFKNNACPFGAPTKEQWLSDWEETNYEPCGFFAPSSQHSCPHLKHGPFYLFPAPFPKEDQNTSDYTDMYWCIVHPEENERMERIISGTDNPLYDFVHELRYNPNISSKLGSEREEAQDDFEQSKKRKV